MNLNHQAAVTIRIREGFHGQILYVIPRTMLQQLAAQPRHPRIRNLKLYYY